MVMNLSFFISDRGANFNSQLDFDALEDIFEYTFFSLGKIVLNIKNFLQIHVQISSGIKHFLLDLDII